MSSPSAIRLESVCVRFRPFIDRTPTLRRSLAKLRHRATQMVHALDDVSFEVGMGSSLAVVGRNGAGKSTLLRVLAGTLQPDSGRVETYVKNIALLQLGTGFNPQLSGRMNIYLAGLAAGLSKGEVDERFDDIVEFSELADALERPIKTYSSGMTSRLGFAIAMNMKPDVLLVDEVLSVGDEAFRSKSEQAMIDLIDRSGTLVFVTHSLNKAMEICETALWLDAGRVRGLGPADNVIPDYRRTANEENRQRMMKHGQ